MAAPNECPACGAMDCTPMTCPGGGVIAVSTVQAMLNQRERDYPLRRAQEVAAKALRDPTWKPPGKT